MLSKSRLITVGLAAVATAVLVGQLRKSAAAAVKAGEKAENTWAGKLGLI